MTAPARKVPPVPGDAPGSRRALYVSLVALSAVAAVLGFAREAAMGALFGASREADAFYAAFALPFVVAYFLVGGALVPPLVAGLAAHLTAGRDRDARALFSGTLLRTAAAGGVLVAAVALLARPIARLLVPGFPSDAIALTARLLAELAAYGLFSSLALVLSAGATAAGLYRIPAFAILAANGLSVLLLLALTPRLGIHAATLSLLVASALQLLVVLPFVLRAGLLGFAAATEPRPPSRATALLTLALVLSATVDLAERPFASAAGVGAVALLGFASKLIHLPMRLVAAPLATVALPRLAAARTAGEKPEEAATLLRAIVNLLLLSSALAAGAAGPAVALAFGRGRFDAAAVASLASLVVLLAPSVLFIGLIETTTKLLVTGSRLAPVVLAQGAGLAVYLVAAPVLAPRGIEGLAFARNLSWGTAAFLLTVALARSENGLGVFARAPRRLFATLLALGAAAAAVSAGLLPGPLLLTLVAGTAGTAAFLLALPPRLWRAA
ncbi:MAG: hypothetical protein JNK60_13425 [Acidobacteria bacterium]|nr:hypothetical protein [Acidobacteriota bacterium]